jgi:MOSC domain-containing protein YiiM
MPDVQSVNVAMVSTGSWTGNLGRSGIDKRPVGGRTRVRAGGIDGDTVCDRKHHGGLDRAVYAFAAADYAYWEQRLGRAFAPGSFGENLTVVGVDINAARLGDQWSIGTALLEITAPRTACRVFGGFLDVSDMVRQFTQHGRPGAYLRVLTEGDVGPGDELRVVRQTDMMTVGDAFRAMTTDPSLLPRLAEAVEFLPTDVRVRTDRRLARRPARA